MADILIRMKMPKCCCCCPCFNDEYYYCQAADIDLGRIQVESRHPNCPLIEVPPHGDLIDRDVLYKEFESIGWFNNADRDIAEDALLDAPTILSASEVE